MINRVESLKYEMGISELLLLSPIRTIRKVTKMTT